MKKTLGNTRKLRNKRGKKTKKVVKGGASLPSMDDKTEALRIKITEIVKKENSQVPKISDSQQIIFDLIKDQEYLYYLSYNNQEGRKTEYNVIVSNNKPDNFIETGSFTLKDSTNKNKNVNFYIIEKIKKKNGNMVEGREKEASELDEFLRMASISGEDLTSDNTWELLITKDKNTDFDKYYLPLLNLISEQHIKGILTGEFNADDVEVQGDKVKFIDDKGKIFEYKINEENKLEGCESKYQMLNEKLKKSCGESLGKTRQDILDNLNIREKVKNLVYADLYNLKNIFGEIYDKIKDIKLSEGNSKYSETTETLENVVELFK
jgi:hypothetical protein